MTPAHPSRTAEAVAWMRARDQRRPRDRRVVDNPYAFWFLGSLARASLGVPSWFTPGLDGLNRYVQARHRHIDEGLLSALAAGAKQVVVLGAGYDMRAHRFAGELAGRVVFEVDFPSTLNRKLHCLEGRSMPVAVVRRVPIDFETNTLAEVLIPAGFVVGSRTVFVWEGVSMYLTIDAVTAMLGALHELGGPGSVLLADFGNLPSGRALGAVVNRWLARTLQIFDEPVRFSLPPESALTFLDHFGWELEELTDAQALLAYSAPGRSVYPYMYLVRARRNLG